LGSNHDPTCSKAVSPRNQAKHENTPEERGKMGCYGAETSLSKFAKHFSLLLDAKL